MSTVQVQYFSVFILASMIGSNIFVNLILVGSGEVIAGIFSGYLYANYKDVRAF